MRTMTEQDLRDAELLKQWAEQGKNMKMITPKMKKAAESYEQDKKQLESYGSFTVGKWEGKKRKY